MQAKPANTVHAAQVHAAQVQAARTAMGLEATMAKTGSNPVAQILANLGEFFEWRDYPQGGVWDRTTGFGYFYHAHPGGAFDGEHGHFHLFWGGEPDTRSNLVGLSMDGFGRLAGAFAPNRWHAALDETGDYAARYGAFQVDLAYPCYAANQWLGATVRALAPRLGQLHAAALRVLAEPGVAEDRGRPVVAKARFDHSSVLAPPSRPSLKSVKR